MQHFVVIFGPPAVGKMTVATALSKRLGYPLFHNHLSIELLLPFFEFGSASFNRLNKLIRKSLLEEAANGDAPGFIFTYVWSLKEKTDKQYVDEMAAIFSNQGWELLFVELETTFEERTHRNKTEFRLSQKPSKRDIEATYRRMLKLENSEKQLNSNNDFHYPDRHLKIINTNLSAESTAAMIIEHFSLEK